MESGECEESVENGESGEWRVENGEWGVVSGECEWGGGGGKPRRHNTQHQPLTHTQHGVECQQSGSGGDVVVAKIDNPSLESLKWVRGQCVAAAESF